MILPVVLKGQLQSCLLRLPQRILKPVYCSFYGIYTKPLFQKRFFITVHFYARVEKRKEKQTNSTDLLVIFKNPLQMKNISTHTLQYAHIFTHTLKRMIFNRIDVVTNEKKRGETV